jgi:hypothetical protein
MVFSAFARLWPRLLFSRFIWCNAIRRFVALHQ